MALESSIHIVKAQDYKGLGLQLPVITLFGQDETQYFDAQAVQRKIGQEKWRELSSKYTSLMVDSSLLVEDFDPITNF